jgi:hypothetical protein
MAKAQASTEILILIGISLFLLIPVILYAYGRASVSGEDLSVQKAEFAANRLSSLADSVGYLGGNASVVDEIEIPPYVKSLTVDGNDIIIEMDSSYGRKQIVSGTAFGLEDGGDLARISKAGTYFIEVRALSGGNVSLRLR